MRRGTFTVWKNGWLDYDGYVRKGEEYIVEDEENDGGHFVLKDPYHKRITNIITTFEDAIKLGDIKYWQTDEM